MNLQIQMKSDFLLDFKEQKQMINLPRKRRRNGAYKIVHFHKAAGHPTPRKMVRRMNDAQLPRWKIQMTLDYKCPICEEIKPGGSSSGKINPASIRELPAPLTH